MPVQVEPVAGVVRCLQGRSIEVHVGRLTVGQFLPRFGDKVLVLIEDLEHLGIEGNVASCLQALQIFFVRDVAFAFRKHRYELHPGKIHFFECGGLFVFFDNGVIAWGGEVDVQRRRAVDLDDGHDDPFRKIGGSAASMERTAVGSIISYFIKKSITLLH